MKQQAILDAQLWQERILQWFAQNGRHDLPWQQTVTPYRVWISEIMLQQTQVSTVIPYFERFMQRFPDLATLAAAPLDDILHHWTGLGYYARARNLHRSAQMIEQQHNGQFPNIFEQIMSLPGIGRSTAGAISSLALHQPQPILDGNVKRVLARTHAIAAWPGEKNTLDQLWKFAEYYTPTRAEDVAAYTQAMMDLGATVCQRRNPTCDQCPLYDHCLGKTEPHQYPGSKPKKTLPTKQVHFVLIQYKTNVLLMQRPHRGIWGGLWSFPECDQSDVANWLKQTYAFTAKSMTPFADFRHTFSHYHLAIRATHVILTRKPKKLVCPQHIWYNMQQPVAVGLATPIKSLLTTLSQSLGVCHES